MKLTIEIQFKRGFILGTTGVVKRETNKGSSIEFGGYWMLEHEQNGCAVLSQGINQQNCVRLF